MRFILAVLLVQSHVQGIRPDTQESTEKDELNALSALLFSVMRPSSLASAVAVPRRGNVAMQSLDGISDSVNTRVRIAQEAIQSGAGFKQGLANVLAGEYDADSVKSELEEAIKSHPCVMFTWQSSPSCKKAIEYLDKAGASYKVVRLDDPWDKGNVMRAELGKMFGRTSVPFIFIDGKYVGGFDGGLDDDPFAPGILELAFKGTLRPKLKGAGALPAEA